MIYHTRRKISAIPKLVFSLKWKKNILCKPNSKEIEKIFLIPAKIFTQSQKKCKAKASEIPKFNVLCATIFLNGQSDVFATE